MSETHKLLTVYIYSMYSAFKINLIPRLIQSSLPVWGAWRGLKMGSW